MGEIYMIYKNGVPIDLGIDYLTEEERILLESIRNSSGNK